MERLRIGLVGCGSNMSWHVSELLKSHKAVVKALVDPVPTQIENFRRRFPDLVQTPAFSDDREMLASTRLDAVIISTPHTLHLEQLQRAFAHDLHVMVEKPLATTIEDCEAAISARDTVRKIGYLSYQRHIQPEYRFVRREIQSGRAGKVLSVSANLTQNWKSFTGGTWRQDPSLSGGGMFLDSGSHMLDMLLWLTGIEPASVSAHIDARETPVDINAVAVVHGRAGEIATINIVGDAIGWHEEFFVICERATYLLHNGRLETITSDGHAKIENMPGGMAPPHAFIAAIEGGEVPASFEDGLQVMKLSQAAFDSAAAGGVPVSIS